MSRVSVSLVKTLRMNTLVPPETPDPELWLMSEGRIETI